MSDIARMVQLLEGLYNLRLVEVSDIPRATYPIEVGIQPTVIVQAPGSETGLKKVRIINTDPAVVAYIGNSSVTPANGYTLFPGQSETFVLRRDQSLYGITNGVDVGIRVMEL